LHAIRDSLAYLLRIVFGFRIEQRLPDDGKREAGHFFRNVDSLIVYPPVSLQTVGVNRHDFRVTRDAIPMESRLRETALPVVKLTFTGQQPITQHSLGLLQPTPFLKTRLLRYQYVLYVVRMIYKEIVLRSGAKISNVPVVARKRGQKLYGIKPK
jgi:hypothetical protein